MTKVLQELEPLQYLMAAVTLVGIVYLCYMEYQESKAAPKQGFSVDRPATSFSMPFWSHRSDDGFPLKLSYDYDRNKIYGEDAPVHIQDPAEHGLHPEVVSQSNPVVAVASHPNVVNAVAHAASSAGVSVANASSTPAVVNSPVVVAAVAKAANDHVAAGGSSIQGSAAPVSAVVSAVSNAAVNDHSSLAAAANAASKPANTSPSANAANSKVSGFSSVNFNAFNPSTYVPSVQPLNLTAVPQYIVS